MAGGCEPEACCAPAFPKRLVVVGFDVSAGGAPAGVVDPNPRSGFAGVA